MKVKLCGFSEENSLKAAIEHAPDFIGFVFHENSPRNITPQQALNLAQFVPQKIAKVAVVVDAKIDFLREIAKSLNPQYFQLHGQENIAKILEIKQNFPEIGIIKAFSPENRQDLEKTAKFIDFVDFLLFDNKIAGSGKLWDFSLLNNFICKKDWFLSGGLNIQNIEQILKNSNAKMIDISSGIEEIRGEKSPKLIAEFMQKIRKNARNS